MRVDSLQELHSIAKRLDVKVYRRATNKDQHINGLMEMAWEFCTINPTNLDWKTERFKPFDQYYIILTDCILALADRK